MLEYERWPWFALYREAVLEFDHAKQPALIEEAEKVMARRLKELEQSTGASPELEALHNAMGALDALKRRRPQ